MVLLAPPVLMEFLDKEVLLVNLVRMAQKESRDKEASGVKMAFLVPLVPQEKKEKQDHLVSLAQMAYLELQEKGVPLVSVALLVVMELLVKRVLLVKEVVQALQDKEVFPVNQGVMAVLVFQE